MTNAHDEALNFVLTFARPPDLSLSSDETSWREFDADALSREELARRLGLWAEVEGELERLTRKPGDDTDQRRITDLHEDLVRIFGDELGEVEVATSPECWPVIRSTAGTHIYFRTGGPTSTFACHRKLGDRVEATLWNRAVSGSIGRSSTCLTVAAGSVNRPASGDCPVG